MVVLSVHTVVLSVHTVVLSVYMVVLSVHMVVLKRSQTKIIATTTFDHMSPDLQKGPLRVVVIRITLSGRPAMFLFMFWAISTVNGTILLMKTHFSYFDAT